MMSFKLTKRIRALAIHKIRKIKYKKKESQTACKKNKILMIAQCKNNN